MGVWTCVDHEGHYPVGVASVIVAENMDAAYAALRCALEDVGLSLGSASLQELDASTPSVTILNDGNY